MATKIQELEASMLRFEAELVLMPKKVLRSKEAREKLTELRNVLKDKIEQIKDTQELKRLRKSKRKR